LRGFLRPTLSNRYHRQRRRIPANACKAPYVYSNLTCDSCLLRSCQYSI
jgi:hypothetical protein